MADIPFINAKADLTHVLTCFPIRYYHITRNTFCTQKATNL